MATFQVKIKLDRYKPGFQNAGHYARQHFVPCIASLAAHDREYCVALLPGRLVENVRLKSSVSKMQCSRPMVCAGKDESVECHASVVTFQNAVGEHPLTGPVGWSCPEIARAAHRTVTVLNVL